MKYKNSGSGGGLQRKSGGEFGRGLGNEFGKKIGRTLNKTCATIMVSALPFFLSHADAADMQKFIPFEEFSKNTGTARYEDYAKKTEVKVKNQAEFETMKKHIVSMYEGVKVKNSFILGEADHVDCVAAETQPGLRQGDKRRTLAKAPPPKIAREKSDKDGTRDGQLVEPMLSAQKKDGYGNVQFCETGFIPMRRITLDELVRYETLGDFFNKYGTAGEKGLPLRK